MPTATVRERRHAARCRWLCTALYLGGLRASEVTGTAMGAFFCRRDARDIERWWLEVTGKGNKTRLVPATDELIAELARYRRAHALPPTPQPEETRPLVLPVIARETGRDNALSRGALHLILKEVFGIAAERLRARVGGAGRCAGERLSALAAPHRRLAHDRPAGRPALCARQLWPCLDCDHQRLPAQRRGCAARGHGSGTALLGPARRSAAPGQ